MVRSRIFHRYNQIRKIAIPYCFTLSSQDTYSAFFRPLFSVTMSLYGTYVFIILNYRPHEIENRLMSVRINIYTKDTLNSLL